MLDVEMQRHLFIITETSSSHSLLQVCCWICRKHITETQLTQLTKISQLGWNLEDKLGENYPFVSTTAGLPVFVLGC